MKRALPVFALVLSGASSLVLEVIWTRIGVLTFGSTTTAVTVVFSIFMLGLAFGNGLSRWMIVHVRHPFRAYAIAEGSAALVSLGFGMLYGRLLSLSTVPSIVYVLSMLIATTFMGLSIPMVVAGINRSDDGGPWSVPVAYGMNTLGAACGAWLGAFILIPGLGLKGSTLIAVLGLGAAALLGWTADQVLPSGPVEPNPRAQNSSPERKMAPWLVIAFWGGASSLSMEIVWTRLLSLILGPSVYALGTILFVYLLGIGIGSVLSTRVLKRMPKMGIGVALLLLSAALAQSAFSVGLLPYLFAMIVKGWMPNVSALRSVEVILSVVALFPSALLHGFLVPALVGRISEAGKDAEGAASVLSVNTLGAIAGAIATGLYFVPTFGLLPIFLTVLALHAAIGFRLLTPALAKGQRVLLLTVVTVLVVALEIGIFRSWDRAVLSCGVYKYTVGKILAGGDSTIEVGNLLYYKEGRVSTVAVTELINDVVLMIDGKADASIHGDRSTQVLLAVLPLSLSERTDRALVIGYASGITAGVATLFPGTHVTSVEIEPSVYEAANRFFSSVNFGPLKPPTHQALVADGRHFLRNTKDRFDVITSEPSNPWMSGVAPLFSREFFDLAKGRLAQGGVMCQWLPIYGMSRELVGSILRTFHEIYPHVLVFASTEGNDLLLIGSEEEIELDPQRVDGRWKNTLLKNELHQIQIDSGFDLIGRFMMGNAGVERFSSEAPLNTDDNGFVEYEAPKTMHLHTAEMNDRALTEHSDSIWPYLQPRARTEQVKNELAARFHGRGKVQLEEALR